MCAASEFSSSRIWLFIHIVMMLCGIFTDLGLYFNRTWGNFNWANFVIIFAIDTISYRFYRKLKIFCKIYLFCRKKKLFFNKILWNILVMLSSRSRTICINSLKVKEERETAIIKEILVRPNKSIKRHQTRDSLASPWIGWDDVTDQ